MHSAFWLAFDNQVRNCSKSISIVAFLYKRNFLQSRVGNGLDFVARGLDIFFRPATLTRELSFFLF